MEIERPIYDGVDNLEWSFGGKNLKISLLHDGTLMVADPDDWRPGDPDWRPDWSFSLGQLVDDEIEPRRSQDGSPQDAEQLSMLVAELRRQADKVEEFISATKSGL